jgi:hypothetical protein
MCGSVRFELSEPPMAAMYCHCKRCQRRTGTAVSMTALTRHRTFEVTEGEELPRFPERADWSQAPLDDGSAG